MKALLVGILCLFTSFSYAQMIKLGGLTSSRYDIHIVEKGETLYSISKSFNTTVGELLKLNPEIHNNQLEEGQIINVPVSKVVLNLVPFTDQNHAEGTGSVLVLAPPGAKENSDGGSLRGKGH